MSNVSCSDMTIGGQIWRYELDDLEPAERERFESHLMVCAACRSDVAKMLPVIETIRTNRADLLTRLQSEGITFEKLRAEIGDATEHTVEQETISASWRSRLTHWRAGWRRSWVLVPAMAVAVIGMVMLILWNPRHSAYLGLLKFEPLLYERHGARGNEALEKSDPFSQAMDAYSAGDYRKATSRLSRVVTRDPANATGWLYLGVSHYLRKHAPPAIRALRHAASSTDPGLRDAAQWYLAQALLLNNQADSAVVRLNGLDKSSRWSSQADSLAMNVKTWKGTR